MGQRRCDRVLITGATGFIGGNLVRALTARGVEVRALVRDRQRAGALDGVRLVEGDLLHPDSLEGIEEGVDAVIHCASLLGKWGMADAELYDVNVRGTVHLLQRFEARDLQRFVHLSAGGVTGPLELQAVDESYSPRPATAYEKTKLLGERKVLELSRSLGIPATVVRPTFTYGPGDPHKLALFRAIKKGRYVFIGKGESVNHPVYIDDLISGILLALDRAREGQVYIIGGERPVTKKELVDTIADSLGVSRPRLSVPRWTARAAAPVFEMCGRMLGFEPLLTRSRVMMMADNFGYSISKARNELGYEPRTDLRTGIRSTVESYRRNGLI